MPDQEESRYRVLFGKNAKKWRSTVPTTKHHIVERFIRDHLALKPLERVPGKTKLLKGAHKGVLQYDIDNNFRIHYAVDTGEQIVRVLYIGPHPDW